MSKRKPRLEELDSADTSLSIDERPDHHIPDLVIVRESDASDRILLENMIVQTMHAHQHDLPQLADLAAAGLDPLLNPDKWNAIVRKSRDSHSVVFVYQDVLIAYHSGSAARVDAEDGDNDFCSLVLELIETYQPARLRLATFSRLVRSEKYASRLYERLLEHKVAVMHSRETMKVWEMAGGIMWSTLVMFAAMERTTIVERLVVGRIAVARKGGFPFRDAAVPPGYRLGADRRLEVDPDQVDAIREALLILADNSLSNAQAADAMGQLGITRPLVQETYGDDATVADMRHPKDLRGSFEHWLELYETGTYRRVASVALNTHAIIAGCPIRETEDGGRVIVLSYDWGVPAGGWAEPEVFEAIRSRREQDLAFTNDTRRVRPLSGRPCYEWNGQEYRMSASDHSCYVLESVVRDHATGGAESNDATTHPTRASRYRSLARVEVGVLHRAVVDAILDQLGADGGVPGELKAGMWSSASRLVTDDSARRRALERRAGNLSQRAAQARQAALDFPTQAHGFIAEANRHDEERRVLEAQLVLIESNTPTCDSAFQIDLGLITTALSLLRDAEGPADGRLRRALDSVIPVFRLFPVSNDTVGFDLTLRLPHPEGAMDIGPISGTVPVKSNRRRFLGDTVDGEPLAPVCLRAFAAGRHPVHIADDLLLDRVVPVMDNIRAGLEPLGLSVDAIHQLMLSPYPELRSSVTGGLLHLCELGRSDPSLTSDELTDIFAAWTDRPADASPEWVAHCVVTYRSLATWFQVAYWNKKTAEHQRAVRIVKHVGGSMELRELAHALGKPGQHRELLQLAFPRSGTGRCAVLTAPEPPAGKASIPGSLPMSLVVCPHCASPVTRVIATPEVTRQLLCEACRRMPDLDSPVFPASYVSSELPEPNDLPSNWWYRDGSYSRSTSRSRWNRDPVDPDVMTAALEAYKAGQHIQGPGGILVTYGLTQTKLYNALSDAGIPGRRPFRPRTS